MGSNGVFGSTDPGSTDKPSVLSVIVEQAVQEFTPYYHPVPGGHWHVGSDGLGDIAITAEDFAADIAQWVRSLRGGDALGDAIVVLVKGNPGWEKIIARRVMKELRKWAA